MNHTSGNGKAVGIVGDGTDVMAQGSDTAGTRTFSVTADAMRSALGVDWTSAQAQNAIDYFAAYIAAGGDFNAPAFSEDPNVGAGLPIGDGLLSVTTDPGIHHTQQLDFGTIGIDGFATQTLRLKNLGDQPLSVTAIGMNPSGTSAFVVTPSAALPRVLAPGQSFTIEVKFDPAASGDHEARLSIANDGIVGLFNVELSGFALSPNGDVRVEVDNNNLGGVRLSDAAKTVADFGTLSNIGASPLRVTSVQTTNSAYAVVGLPAVPFDVQPGQSLPFGVAFGPATTGIHAGAIRFLTNDPEAPITLQPITGTGVANVGSGVQWGDDFVTLVLDGTETRRLRSAGDGAFHFSLPANTRYEISLFDPISGLVSHSSGLTSGPGELTDFGPPAFRASVVADGNGNGLPDDVDALLGDSRLFDFGTVNSPVSPGYASVAATTGYTAQRGFGWLTLPGTSVTDADRGAVVGTSSLTRDFNLTSDATFAVDLPPGFYDVTITAGDATVRHDQMQIFAEGTLRGSISAQPGQFITDTYRVRVSDGQLNLRLVGGEQVAIDSLELVKVRDATPGPSSVRDLGGEFFFVLEHVESGALARGHVDLVSGEALCANGVGLVPNSAYRQWVLHADTMRVGVSEFFTPGAGQTFSMPQIIVQRDDSRDTDGDGLSDVAEFVIGTSEQQSDTDDDGISDAAEIEQRLDPLDDRGFPTGVISSLPLAGEAKQVAVAPGSGDIDRIAYVATGSAGLALVDVSVFNNPVVLGQVALAGDSVDVAVSTSRDLAVLAGSVGVQLVDVSDPMLPVLAQTIALPTGARAIVIADGIAYAAAGSALISIDLATGERLQTLDFGTAPITDVAREGSMLYTIDTSRTLRAVDVSSFEMVSRDSLVMPQGGGNLFVGNGIAYVLAADTFIGGFGTANVSDPNDLLLISGSDVVDPLIYPRTDIAVNGSGIGVMVGEIGRTTTGQNVMFLVDTTDPQDTDSLVLGLDLPARPNAIEIASGIAFVASGSAGLQVVNYLSFDSQRQAPTVSISASVFDADATLPGVQALEGTSIPVIVSVTDDVQVRRVELIVNGVVRDSDESFPFELAALVPALTSGVTNVALQVRAIDTGGNAALSNILTYDVSEDLAPPVVIGTTPNAGQKVFFTPSIDVRFSEPLDESLVDVAGVSLMFLGADGVPGGDDDVSMAIADLESRTFGRRLSVIPATILDTGNYQLTLAGSIIEDQAGNALAAPFSFQFNVRPASDVRAVSGTAAIDRAPSANAGQVVGFRIPGASASSRITFTTTNGSGTVATRQVAPVFIDTSTQIAYFTVPVDATTGDVTIQGDPDGPFLMQIVPTLSLVDFTSLAVDGSTAGVRLRGTGFVEGANSRYVFGATTMLDASPFSGPDVFAGYVHENDAVNLTLDTSGDYRGAVRVTTNGGTSAPYSLGYTQLTSVAASGTPANAALASANPGQLVTLAGSGFSSATDVIGTWYDYNVGAVQRQLLSANFVDATGTQLTVPIPNHFSGAFALEVVGSAFAPTLQIVPVVDTLSLTGVGALRIRGRGFVEGNNSQYTLAGGTVTDVDGSSGPNVFWGFVHPADGVDLALPAHGVGNFIVTTSGGTSAPLAANFLHPAAGDLRDVAFDGTNLWVATAAGQVRKIAATTGATLATWPIPGGGASGTGLAVLTSPMTLAGVAVPAGHLLVSSWNFAPDRIMAINPADGAVVATLNLAENLDPVAMQYDPSGGGHLYVLDTSPDEVVEINPATGARIRAFATTLPAGGQDAGGLAFHPTTGNLWIGASNTPLVAELNPTTGALVRQVDLAPFGLANDISGLAFDNNLRLLVSSYRTGTVHSIDLAAPAPPMAPAALVDAAMRVNRFRAPPVRNTEERLVAGRMRMHYVQRIDAALEQLDRTMEMPNVRRLAADARVVRRSAGEDQLGANE